MPDVEDKRLRPWVGLFWAAVPPLLKVVAPAFDWEVFSQFSWTAVLGFSAFMFPVGLFADWLAHGGGGGG